MTANQIGGHAAIALLETYGAEVIFGIPGVHTLDLYRGIADRGLRHIGVRHEQGAGFMADGYARASGKPGLCCLITGPGLMNAATAIGQAYSDSVPVLILASVNASGDLGHGRGRLHEIVDQRAAIAPLTAFTRTIRQARDLAPAMADAYRIFESARPRPVVLEFPLDMLAAPADIGRVAREAAPRPMPGEGELAKAAALIDAAKRIFVIAGGGTLEAGAELRRFVEKSGALVATTTAGKGIIPDSHPASLGGTLSLKPTLKALAGTDLVIAIGTELAETDSWVDRLPIKGKLIRIDLDPYTLTRDYAPEIGLLGDAGPCLADLCERIAPGRKADLAQAEAIRAENLQNLNPLQRKHKAVLDALRRALPEDGIVATDMTQIAYTGNVVFPCERPRGWFHPNGFGTLGYALPAAIGAKIACPERAVAAMAGDAGFLFTVQDLGTAVELGLPLPILLWNNDALGQIAGDMIARDIPELGVKPRNPDYQALAKSFGAAAERPDNLAALTEALRRAFSAKSPTLIEIRQDSSFLP